MTDATTQLAFPGAVGYGRFTAGGRGGKVYHITTLEDATPAPPGSLRECIVASGPRIGVFDVAGTIELVAQLTITNPYLTIAGQTAPGEGICLKSSPSNMDAALSPRCDHVLFSNLKFRPGPGGTSIAGPRHGDAVDGIGNLPSDLIARNHYYRCCSISWSVDELLELRLSEATVDSCLLAEPLNLSTHSYTVADPKIGHAKAILAAYPGCGNLTLFRVVTAHTMDRQPAELSLEFGVADIVNCGIYGWGTDAGFEGGRPWVLHLSDHFGNLGLNLVNNWFKPGPESANRTRIWYGRHPESVGDQVAIYLAGNLDLGVGLIEEVFCEYPDDCTLHLLDTPLGDAAYGVPLPVWAAYDLQIKEGQVGDWYRLNDMGQRVPRADAVDRRILQEIAEGSGRIINHPDEVGGWPELETGQPLDWNDHDVPRAFAEHHPDSTIDDFIWR